MASITTLQSQLQSTISHFTSGLYVSARKTTLPSWITVFIIDKVTDKTVVKVNVKNLSIGNVWDFLEKISVHFYPYVNFRLIGIRHQPKEVTQYIVDILQTPIEEQTENLLPSLHLEG